LIFILYEEVVSLFYIHVLAHHVAERSRLITLILE